MPLAALRVVAVMAALSVAGPLARRQKRRLAVTVRLAVASAESVYVAPSDPHHASPLAMTANAGRGSLVDGAGLSGSSVDGGVGSRAEPLAQQRGETRARRAPTPFPCRQLDNDH